MNFFQTEFVLFLALLVFVLFFLKKNTIRKVLLLAASYYFYAYWDYRFLLLILLTTSIDYTVGRLLGVVSRPGKRKGLLLISLVFNLGILGFFKYFNFFIDSFQELLAPLNIQVQTLNILLPLGISFYTFQTLTYTIERYRKKIPTCRSLLDYALFVAFFPKIVAGPIERAAHFLPQLKTTPSKSRERYVSGFILVTTGLFKKLFLADNLGFFVGEVFANYTVYDTPTIWLAVLCYSLQIYCDFAGYTDLARGFSKWLGYDLLPNFNFPYLARNISDFWRRWHITLSTWIRDYIYIPLGGNRKGMVRTYANLLIAMTLCGLWHGAAWTFVVWGGYHGVSLVLQRIWSGRIATESKAVPPAWGTALSILFTFFIVTVGWVFFRSQNLAQALQILEYMFTVKSGTTWMHPFGIFALTGALFIHLLEMIPGIRVHGLDRRAWYTPALLFSLLWLVILFYPRGFTPFIYVQF